MARTHLLKALGLVAAVLLLPTCQPLDLTGIWVGQWHSALFNGDFTMDLTQADDGTLEGSFEIGGTWCVGSGDVTGSLDDRNFVALLDNGIGGEVELQGNVGPAGNSIDGGFTVTGGSCDDSTGRFDVQRQ